MSLEEPIYKIVIIYNLAYTLASFFTEKGYLTAPFRSGIKATKFIIDEKRKGKNIDLVITDLQPNGMYIGTFFDYLKENDINIPIIGINNGADSLIYETGVKRGMKKIFETPFIEYDLEKCVKQLLQESQ